MCRFAVKAFLVLSVLIAAVGCRSTPVYNVTNQSIGTAGGKAKSLQEVKTAIVEAGKARGWSMKDIEPGHLDAELHVRGHVAVVDIKYSTTSYSISYKRTEGVEYDGTKIYGRYNTWIENLQQEIDKRL